MRAIGLASPGIVTADEATSLREAAQRMREEAIGDIVVTRGEGAGIEAIGIVTDRDLVVHVLADDIDEDAISVKDLCTRPLAAVDGDADLTELTSVMNKNGVRRVLVTHEGRPVGIVTLDNVLTAIARLMNNLTAMVERQIEYERDHLHRPSG